MDWEDWPRNSHSHETSRRLCEDEKRPEQKQLPKWNKPRGLHEPSAASFWYCHQLCNEKNENLRQAVSHPAVQWCSVMQHDRGWCLVFHWRREIAQQQWQQNYADRLTPMMAQEQQEYNSNFHRNSLSSTCSRRFRCLLLCFTSKTSARLAEAKEGQHPWTSCCGWSSGLSKLTRGVPSDVPDSEAVKNKQQWIKSSSTLSLSSFIAIKSTIRHFWHQREWTELQYWLQMVRKRCYWAFQIGNGTDENQAEACLDGG